MGAVLNVHPGAISRLLTKAGYTRSEVIPGTRGKHRTEGFSVFGIGGEFATVEMVTTRPDGEYQLAGGRPVIFDSMRLSLARAGYDAAYQLDGSIAQLVVRRKS
jgi:hypothetical protein